MNDLANKCRILINIGQVYRAWRKYDEAFNFYQQAKKITEDIGDKLGYGAVLQSMGKYYEELGKYEESINLLEQVRKSYEEMGLQRLLSSVLNMIGLVFQKTGNYGEAYKHYQLSLQIKDNIDDKHGLSLVLNNIGKLERELKDFSKAIYNHKKALEIVTGFEAIHDIAKFSKELALDYKEMNNYKKALEYFEKSLSNYREILVKTPIEYQKAFESEFEELYGIIAELNEIMDKSQENIPQSLTDDIRKISQILEQSDIEGLKANFEDFITKIEKDKELVQSFTIDPSINKEILVFVSYVTNDAELFKVKEIAKSLTTYERIKDSLYWEKHTEDNIQKYMSDSLGKCDVVLLFCSPKALLSKPVEDEWTTANTLQKPIIPIFNDPDHIPTLLKPRMGVKYDIFDLQKNIGNIYNLIIKKVDKRLVDLKDLKTDF